MALSIEPTLLIGMVVGGVTLVVLTTHWLGGSEPARLSDADEARRLYLADHPDQVPADVLLSADGSAALLAFDAGPPGLVYALGDRFVARPVRQLRTVELGDDHLVLRLGDFVSPTPVRIAADAGALARWHDRLRPLAAGGA